jgi:hypothetical protein
LAALFSKLPSFSAFRSFHHQAKKLPTDNRQDTRDKTTNHAPSTLDATHQSTRSNV